MMQFQDLYMIGCRIGELVTQYQVVQSKTTREWQTRWARVRDQARKEFPNEKIDWQLPWEKPDPVQ